MKLFDNLTEYCGIFTIAIGYCRNFWLSYSKGIWWMPWHGVPMKDVVSCDKPR